MVFFHIFAGERVMEAKSWYYVFILRRELWKHGKDIQLEFDHIVWDKEITLEEAHKLLEVQLYPFKKVCSIIYLVVKSRLRKHH